MLTDEVWHQAGGADYCLCIACLEGRLGRELRRDDFTAVPVNDDHPTDSARTPPFWLVYRLRDGRAVRIEAYNDQGEALKAVGLEE
jgi:hypothetical protein